MKTVYLVILINEGDYHVVYASFDKEHALKSYQSYDEIFKDVRLVTTSFKLGE